MVWFSVCTAAAAFIFPNFSGELSRNRFGEGSRDTQISPSNSSYIYQSGMMRTNATIIDTGESDPETTSIRQGDDSWVCGSLAGDTSPLAPSYVKLAALGTDIGMRIQIGWVDPGSCSAQAKGTVVFSVDNDGTQFGIESEFVDDPSVVEYAGHVRLLDGEKVLMEYMVGDEETPPQIALETGVEYSLDIDLTATSRDDNFYGAELDFELAGR